MALEKISKHPGGLAAAVTSIGIKPALLLIDVTTNLSADLTVPSNITLLGERGCQIIVNAGVTLTVSGGIEAGHYTIFGGDGQVEVDSTNALGKVNVAWFHDPTDDVGQSLNKAWRAVRRISPRLVLPAGNFPCKSEVVVRAEPIPHGSNCESRNCTYHLSGQGSNPNPVNKPWEIDPGTSDYVGPAQIGTVIDCRFAPQGKDFLRVPARVYCEDLSKAGANYVNVRLENFSVTYPQRDGIRIEREGGLSYVNAVSVQTAERHGFFVQGLYGGRITTASAYDCNQQGFHIKMGHSCSIGTLTSRQNGRKAKLSNQAGYPSVILSNFSGASIDHLYIESNDSEALQIAAARGLRINSLYLENNNRANVADWEVLIDRPAGGPNQNAPFTSGVEIAGIYRNPTGHNRPQFNQFKKAVFLIAASHTNSYGVKLAGFIQSSLEPNGSIIKVTGHVKQLTLENMIHVALDLSEAEGTSVNLIGTQMSQEYITFPPNVIGKPQPIYIQSLGASLETDLDLTTKRFAPICDKDRQYQCLGWEQVIQVDAGKSALTHDALVHLLPPDGRNVHARILIVKTDHSNRKVRLATNSGIIDGPTVLTKKFEALQLTSLGRLGGPPVWHSRRLCTTCST